MVGQDRVEVLRCGGVAEPVAAQQHGQRYTVVGTVQRVVEGRGAQAGGVQGIGAGLQHLSEVADTRFRAGPVRFQRFGVAE